MFEMNNFARMEMLLNLYRGVLLEHGVNVGNTIECPVEISYTLMHDNMSTLEKELKRRTPPSIMKLEKKEYKEMRDALVGITTREIKRDKFGRRAVALHTGCVTYQHCTLRGGVLNYTIHMRGMDTRKFVADNYYFVSTARALCRALKVERVDVKIHVDCFHTYTDGTTIYGTN